MAAAAVAMNPSVTTTRLRRRASEHDADEARDLQPADLGEHIEAVVRIGPRASQRRFDHGDLPLPASHRLAPVPRPVTAAAGRPVERGGDGAGGVELPMPISPRPIMSTRARGVEALLDADDDRGERLRRTSSPARASCSSCRARRAGHATPAGGGASDATPMSTTVTPRRRRRPAH